MELIGKRFVLRRHLLFDAEIYRPCREHLLPQRHHVVLRRHLQFEQQRKRAPRQRLHTLRHHNAQLSTDPAPPEGCQRSHPALAAHEGEPS